MPVVIPGRLRAEISGVVDVLKLSEDVHAGQYIHGDVSQVTVKQHSTTHPARSLAVPRALTSSSPACSTYPKKVVSVNSKFSCIDPRLTLAHKAGKTCKHPPWVGRTQRVAFNNSHEGPKCKNSQPFALRLLQVAGVLRFLVITSDNEAGVVVDEQEPRLYDSEARAFAARLTRTSSVGIVWRSFHDGATDPITSIVCADECATTAAAQSASRSALRFFVICCSELIALSEN